MEAEELELIEQRAAAVLAELPGWLWDGESLPVPVEDIADSSFNLLVRDVEDLSTAPDCPPLEARQSLSGLLLAERRQIWVDANEARQWPRRRRFTIAHELGHWVLHRDEQRSLFCRHGSIEDGGRPKSAAPTQPPERPPLPAIETEANAFAAALLMPAELLRRRYRELSGDRFEQLCTEFGASGAAMSRRLRTVI